MAERRWGFRFAAVPVSMLMVLFFFGCAKQPATTMAMAPGPGGSSGAGVSGSDITGQGGSSSGASDMTGAEGRGAGQGRSQVAGAGSSGAAGQGGSQVAGAGSSGAAGQSGRVSGAGSNGNGAGGAGAGSSGGSAGATGGAGSSGSAVTGGGAGQGGAEALAAARPQPQEFASVAELHDIHFEFDRYSLRAEDEHTLATNAQWFRAHPGDRILIEGHCDERGTNEYNLALGQHRAESAMKYLVGQGVPASRITVISYGEERPLCSEHAEDCWAKNRRAHFLVKSR